jgi:hypothetical protein
MHFLFPLDSFPGNNWPSKLYLSIFFWNLSVQQFLFRDFGLSNIAQDVFIYDTL